MKPIRRILLVLDPSLQRTPALARAQALAVALKAQLWLALYDRGPQLGVLGLLDRAEAHTLEAMMREQESRRLAELRQAVAEETSLTVHTIDDAHRLSAQRLEAHVAQHDIDLVIKDVGHESALRRLVFLPLDWELLRSCPAPLWMVGAGASGLPKRIVAAVDPVHPEHGSGALNDAIFAMARALRDTGDGHLRVFSAYAGLPAGIQGMDPMGLSLSYSLDELYERLRVEHVAALDRLLAEQGLPADSGTMLYGPTAFSILDALETFQPDVLVVGTLRRHGLDRLLMGSTVERLIGEAPCDIVAVPANAQSAAESEPPAKH